MPKEDAVKLAKALEGACAPRCSECGAELPPKPRYCSPKCRTKAWRKRGD